MKKRALTTVIITALVLLVVLPSVTFAQTSLLNSLEQAGTAGFGAGATERTLPEILGNVIKVFLSIVGIIFLVLMVYAGYLWMTAQGEEQKVEKSKDTIKAAVIGLIIVVAAYAITNFIVSGLIEAAGSS
jgi:hypothetical protein